LIFKKKCDIPLRSTLILYDLFKEIFKTGNWGVTPTLFQGNMILVKGHFNYKDALTKSLIFIEAQRSGKLPPNRWTYLGDIMMLGTM